MRVPSTFRDRRTAIELQLTPMIDCVFLLMVYFLWSANFGVSELSLPSKLSAPTTAGTGGKMEPPPPELDLPSTVVRVLWNGTTAIWTVNGTPVESLPVLSQRLAAIARLSRDAPIIIDPASDVPLGDVIDVFDLVRLVGFQKVQFAAAMPSPR